MAWNAMHTSRSNAAKAVDGRIAQALGIGASLERTPAAKRQYSALCASFVLLDPT